MIVESFPLKAVDTIGNCQRLAFVVGVSQHMHKITHLWKFELNRSPNLQDNNERKNHPCHTKLCAFRWSISRPQVLNLRSRNQISWKLLRQREPFLTMFYITTPLTNILHFHWFRAWHMICLSCIKDGGHVIVHRLPSHGMQYQDVFLPTSNPISCAFVYLKSTYERYVDGDDK